MDSTGSQAPRIRRGDRTAVVVVDVLNDYEHPDGERLRESAEKVVPVIERVLARARDADVPVIWVNDNHGQWSAGRPELVESARAGAGAALIDPVAPNDDAPFVVKSRHSIFYGSHLEYLLETEEIGRLVLVGQVTEQCILYSALDGYIRHFRVAVPRDAVAHIDSELADAALTMMERNMRAEIVAADDLEL
ncbi:MAG: isochorismatase family cysteine hydrolase [Patulibacter sp.]